MLGRLRVYIKPEELEIGKTYKAIHYKKWLVYLGRLRTYTVSTGIRDFWVFVKEDTKKIIMLTRVDRVFIDSFDFSYGQVKMEDVTKVFKEYGEDVKVEKVEFIAHDLEEFKYEKDKLNLTACLPLENKIDFFRGGIYRCENRIELAKDEYLCLTTETRKGLRLSYSAVIDEDGALIFQGYDYGKIRSYKFPDNIENEIKFYKPREATRMRVTFSDGSVKICLFSELKPRNLIKYEFPED